MLLRDGDCSGLLKRLSLSLGSREKHIIFITIIFYNCFPVREKQMSNASSLPDFTPIRIFQLGLLCWFQNEKDMQPPDLSRMRNQTLLCSSTGSDSHFLHSLGHVT